MVDGAGLDLTGQVPVKLSAGGADIAVGEVQVLSQ